MTTKNDKIIALGLSKTQTETYTEEHINVLYDTLQKLNLQSNSKSNSKSNLQSNKVEVIKAPIKIMYTDKKSVDYNIRYQLLLMFLNTILKAINKPVILDIIEFKNINRDDITKNKNVTDAVEPLWEQLFQIYDKASCRYYAKKITKDYIYTFLKKGLNEIGFQLHREIKSVQVSRGAWKKCSILSVTPICNTQISNSLLSNTTINVSNTAINISDTILSVSNN